MNTIPHPLPEEVLARLKREYLTLRPWCALRMSPKQLDDGIGWLRDAIGDPDQDKAGRLLLYALIDARDALVATNTRDLGIAHRLAQLTHESTWTQPTSARPCEVCDGGPTECRHTSNVQEER